MAEITKRNEVQSEKSVLRQRKLKKPRLQAAPKRQKWWRTLTDVEDHQKRPSGGPEINLLTNYNLLECIHNLTLPQTDQPKFHLARHVTSRHDTTSSTCRARRDERVEPCCSTSSTQPKRMGSTSRTCRIVSRRNVTSQVRLGL